MKGSTKLRLLAAGVLVAGAFALAPAPHPFGAKSAEAYHGTARRSCRRTARRTTRRVARRHIWALPAGYTTVVVSGVTYYEAAGVRYKIVIADGRTAYMPV